MTIVPVDTRYSLGSLFSHSLHLGWAFASFKHPDRKTPTTWVQTNLDRDRSRTNSTNNKFVFSPFDADSGHRSQSVLPEISIQGWSLAAAVPAFRFPLNGHNFSLPKCPITSIGKEAYIRKLDLLIQDLRKNAHLQKVVLSRPIVLPLAKKLNAGKLYRDLCETYPNAYVYAFSHPFSGFWMGATPERLMHYANDTLEMVSLAGTKFGPSPVVWRRKEKEEQSIVTEYILGVLKKLGVPEIKVKGPFTQSAGALSHLKTQLTAKLKQPLPLKRALHDLHPTPAVCGFPKDLAFDWIRKHEGYDRAYYTGFLGAIQEENQMDLFVNLRCMQIFEDAVVLYVGGGITALSNAEEEWLETEAKARILKKVLSPYISINV
ncbi:MAG: chorismate-binding protein [Bacteroidota bacterium]